MDRGNRIKVSAEVRTAAEAELALLSIAHLLLLIAEGMWRAYEEVMSQEGMEAENTLPGIAEAAELAVDLTGGLSAFLEKIERRERKEQKQGGERDE